MDVTKSKEIKANDSSNDDEAFLLAMQVATSLPLIMVLNAASELDLFEIIAKFGDGAHVSPTEIASRLPTHNPDAPCLLDRMLRLLASHSLLTCSLRTLDDGKVERLYGLSPAGKFFVADESGASLASASVLHAQPTSIDSWYHLKDAVLKGGVPFIRAKGMSRYEYMNTNTNLRMAFNATMDNFTSLLMNKILDTYHGFEGLTSLVDVGGGNGKTLRMILLKFPSIKGINFDLPHVTSNAPYYPGIEHVGGNMFESIPQGDAIIAKRICHNWSYQKCLHLFQNCYKALPKTGKVIVIDLIMPEEAETSLTGKYVSQVDNNMLAIHGGKERTEKEFEALSRASGFSNFHIAYCVYGTSVMEFSK